MQFRLRTVLIVLAVGSIGLPGCWKPIQQQPSNTDNVVFGAPSSVKTKSNLVASVGKTSTGHLIEIFDPESKRRMWQSAPEVTHNVNPFFASDGSALFFERWTSRSNGIWAVKMPGGREYPVTTEQDSLADVSPTGKRIIVTRTRRGSFGEDVLIDTDNSEVELDVFGAGGAFLSDDEVLFCPRNGDAIHRKLVGELTSRRLCKGVLPVLDLDKQRFLCVTDAAAPLAKREWTLRDLDGDRLGSLGAAAAPAFSASGEQVVYYSPKLNGELWMWDIESNSHRKIGAPGYISQMKTTPAGVMFFLNEGTDAITAATVDETTWTVRRFTGPLTR